MATIPGAAVVAAHFGETMVLYSEVERVEVVVDGAPPGPNGRLFTVEPKKATKVPYEAGRFILDHLGYTGAVRVEVQESDTGTKYDIPKAKAESLAKLERGDEIRFKGWLNGVITDYVKQNKPVPAPEGAILDIINRRSYNLKQYGVTPIGWGEKAADAEKEALKAQVTAQAKQLEALQAQVAALTKQKV